MYEKINFEEGTFVKNRMDIILIPKQNVESSNPLPVKNEKSGTRNLSKIINFILKKGFHVATNDLEEHCLVNDEGLGIGVFNSLEEMYGYVKRGYPEADIEKYKSEIVSN